MNKDLTLSVSRRELVGLAKELISCRGLSGEEGQLVAKLKRILTDMEFSNIAVDQFGNITAVIPGQDSELSPLLFDCHLDTVGVNDKEKWESDPFIASERNHRIYGRGASDMRGALAALIYALKAISRNKLKRDIVISGSVGEEVQEGMAFAPVLDNHQPNLVIICESTGGKLNIGQRGRAELKLQVRGESAHTSSPEVGCNAVTGMLKWIEQIANLEPPRDKNLGAGIMVLTDIISKPYPGLSVLPEECLVTYDRRLVGEETADSLLTDIKEQITADMKAYDWEFSLELAQAQLTTYTGQKITAAKFAPAWYFSPQEKFVVAASQAFKKAGLENSLGTYSFCTNGSMSAGRHNIPTLGYGPGLEERAHTTNEYVEIAELETAAKGYYALAKVLADN